MTSGLSLSRRVLLLTTLLSPLGCNTSAEQEAPADGIFVARSGDLMLAVVAVDDLVTAYACDGRSEGVSLNTWFHGSLDHGAGTLTAEDGATLDLDFADGLTAELTGAAAPTSFTAAAAVTGDTAGLWWGQSGDWLGGWIVDDAGDQRGAVFKRNTGDVSFVMLPSKATMVTLPDSTVLPVTRMLMPKPVS
jgi:hypothetical protein